MAPTSVLHDDLARAPIDGPTTLGRLAVAHGADALLDNPQLPDPVVLAGHPVAAVRVLAAQHPALDTVVARRLAADPQVCVRLARLDHPRLPWILDVDAAVDLALHPDAATARALAARPDLGFFDAPVLLAVTLAGN